MKCLFVVNSQIKGHKKIVREIHRTFTDATIVYTSFAGHAVEIAQHAVEDGYEYLIAVGGDGTLNEALNGMLHSGVPVNKIPVLGVLQHGSANDFSRTIGFDNTVKGLKNLVDNHSIKRVDVGKIRFHSQDSSIKYFINIAGVGLGAEVVLLREKNSKFWGPKLSYFKAILQGFFSYNRKAVLCISDDWEWKGELLQMAIGNGRYFGHGICVCPDAQVDDGIFHISLFGNLSLTDYIKNMGRLKRGDKVEHSDAHYFKSKEITIEANEKCGIEADGEFMGLAPATISLVPKAIDLLRP